MMTWQAASSSQVRHRDNEGCLWRILSRKSNIGSSIQFLPVKIWKQELSFKDLANVLSLSFNYHFSSEPQQAKW